MKALVAYGSRYGSTKETAGAIGDRIADAGVDVDVRDAADVDGLDDYDLAIVGSGIYAGFLRRRVVRLLHRIARQRPALPVAVFALGPLATEREEPEDWRGARTRLAKALDKVDDLNLVASELFGGVIDPERMRLMFAHHDPIDLRDWRAIERWTDQVLQAARQPAAIR